MFMAERNAAEVIFGVGRVDGHDPELIEFGGDYPALLVGVAKAIAADLVLFDNVLRKAVDGLQRRNFTQDGGSAVAGLFGRIPKGVVTIEFENYLFRLGLDLLQAENVRLFLIQKRLEQALLGNGPDPVDIPRIQPKHVA